MPSKCFSSFFLCLISYSNAFSFPALCTPKRFLKLKPIIPWPRPNFIGTSLESSATEYQKQKIGSQLIDHCKKLYPRLELAVYVENVGAIKFYERCGFKIQVEQVNDDSGFSEYIMAWNEK